MLPESLFAFIWQHREDNPQQLALSAKKTPEIPVSIAAAQVQALQKIRHKIPSWYRPGVYFPFSVSVEQASSESTARFKAALFSGKKMADLTGGVGVDAFFFSRRFESLTYVEQNAELAAVGKHNFQILEAANIDCLHGDASEFLQNTPETFDLIYLDPARRDNTGGRVFNLKDCTPDVLAIKDLLLQKAQRVLVKTAPLLDIQQAVRQLETVSKIWILASGGDCREVLYLLEQHAPAPDDIPMEAVLLKEGEIQTFSFTRAEEQQTAPTWSAPLEYLYEPNPAILKAGAFRCFATRFGLAKLHPNTHLYTAAQCLDRVPGRRFRVLHVCKYDRKAVQALVPEGKANISCRNFPDNPEQVRQKLRLGDGGDTYLFAATDPEGQKLILICNKV